MTTAIHNSIASDRIQSVWIVPETIPGVLVKPAPEHIVAAYDTKFPKQIPEYTNSKEKSKTRDILDRCQGQMPAGEWGFTTDCRPAGLGTPPVEGELLRGLAGKETVIAGVNVEYTPDLVKPSFSIWFLIDHTMLFCSGATIGKADLKISECPVTWEWSGGFMQMGVTGTDPLTSLVTPGDQLINVTDSDKYSLGGYVVLADSTGAIIDDNAGAGYMIDQVTDDTTIHIAPGAVIGVAEGGFIVPLDPGGTIGGNKLESRTAVVSIDGAEKATMDFTWTATDEAFYLDKEKTPTGYPESYVGQQREINGEIILSFKRDDANQFIKAIRGDNIPIILTIGNLPGYILKITMPRTITEIPEPEEDAPIVTLKIPYTALAVNGEDSFKVDYK